MRLFLCMCRVQHGDRWLFVQTRGQPPDGRAGAAEAEKAAEAAAEAAAEEEELLLGCI